MYTIEVKSTFDFDDLMKHCWSGAIDTLNTIRENDKEDELMSFLSMDIFSDTPDLTEVNDLLWFEDEWIFEELGISTEEEDDDDEDEEDDDDVEEE